MIKFSANLGFLWTEMTLPDAIRRARQAGFDAVECHWPYDYSSEEIKAVLEGTGMRMVGINTRLGVHGAEDFGVNAKPGREQEARGYIDEAVAYAAHIGCMNINAVAGKTDGSALAQSVFEDNLSYACDQAAQHNVSIVIEPINQRDAPGYHVSLIEKAIATIDKVGRENLKLMFDCYHTQIMQGDLVHRLRAALPYIGHVQIAAVPDRAEPDHGEINYPYLLNELEGMGWDGYIGAEYRPQTTTDEGLGWMSAYR